MGGWGLGLGWVNARVAYPPHSHIQEEVVEIVQLLTQLLLYGERQEGTHLIHPPTHPPYPYIQEEVVEIVQLLTQLLLYGEGQEDEGLFEFFGQKNLWLAFCHMVREGEGWIGGWVGGGIVDFCLSIAFLSLFCMFPPPYDSNSPTHPPTHPPGP